MHAPGIRALAGNTPVGIERVGQDGFEHGRWCRICAFVSSVSTRQTRDVGIVCSTCEDLAKKIHVAELQRGDERYRKHTRACTTCGCGTMACGLADISCQGRFECALHRIAIPDLKLSIRCGR